MGGEKVRKGFLDEIRGVGIAETKVGQTQGFEVGANIGGGGDGLLRTGDGDAGDMAVGRSGWAKQIDSQR